MVPGRMQPSLVTRVHLGYDDSLFSGPAVNPTWPDTYIPENVVSPITALWVNEGRQSAGSDGTMKPAPHNARP